MYVSDKALEAVADVLRNDDDDLSGALAALVDHIPHKDCFQLLNSLVEAGGPETVTVLSSLCSELCSPYSTRALPDDFDRTAGSIVLGVISAVLAGNLAAVRHQILQAVYYGINIEERRLPSHAPIQRGKGHTK